MNKHSTINLINNYELKNKALVFALLFLASPLLVSPAVAEVNNQSIVQLFQRIEILEKKARELNGENEILRHKLEQLKKAQKQGFLNVDEQLDEIRESLNKKPASQSQSQQKTPTTSATDDKAQTTASKQAAKSTAPTVSTGGTMQVPENTNDKDDKNTTAVQKTPIRAPTAYEKETYQAAFNQMSKSPSAATRAFEEYIKLQPNSPLAANAQYWIGEIKYSHNNYKGAVKDFVKVLQKYKNSNKAPDAALKLGYSFYALKDWTYARRTFEDVLRYFPDNANAVNLATKRLEKMTAEGH